MPRHLIFIALLIVGSVALRADIGDDARDVLAKNCQVCHGESLQQSGLNLSTRESILRGGTKGPAVTPGNIETSLLWKMVSGDSPAMPPGGKLQSAELEILRTWISEGAPSSNATVGSTAPVANDLAKLEERPITPEEKSRWAFQSPQKTALPAGASNPIDAFLNKALAEKGLIAGQQADRRTLIRRAYLDLTGLPPTPQQVRAYVDDKDPRAWENLIDKLLASPHYGERWGRHWLDLTHYADSGGYERDFDWPTMWRYRDYVIDAFNKDKPYDLFVREQLAGDEIDPNNPEAHVATGFLRMVLDNNIKDERTRMDELDDNVGTTSLTFLGMTVGCARCHNHKFDPIPQKDYYQMQAVFFSSKGVDYPLASPEEVAQYDAAQKALDDQQKPLKEELRNVEAPYRKRIFDERLDELPNYYRVAWETPEAERTDGQKLNAIQVDALTRQIQRPDVIARLTEAERTRHAELTKKIEDLDEQRPEKYASARAIAEDSPTPDPSYFLHRGNPGSKGSVMDAGVLTVATWQPVKFSPAPAEAPSSNRRRQFAEWIASRNNPLTARVMVNRIWQHHFGEGVVRSTSNFGITGEPPSHPELLDWLAVDFMDRGWSIKQMHRLMMTSDAYQRSSDDLEANLAIDSDNREFWRMPRQRLEAEAIRDQILAVAGTLDNSVGGPAVKPFIDPSLWQSSTDRVWGGNEVGDPDSLRRSVYVFSKRSIRYPMFEAFDQPDMASSCSRRNTSTVAPQALLMMNNAELFSQAKTFAQRLQREAGSSAKDQVTLAFELALSRPPTRSERARSVKFVKSSETGLIDLCQTLFNLNEFVYLQ
ncbi:MAG: PSD1 and planctomycete cytochrome C domain-containing protein [Acidobacteria bacterium]|nr:PSD1 and planctomycete cytochrome C domain-containing protein [Acidobacteriota bacterium]MDA1236395.1 PSD1 and planctomycete cytochrome C domain-containing protein [Acidobacteriota bacterium]